MVKQSNFLGQYSPTILIIMGITLILAGGLTYAIFLGSIISLGLFVLTLGICILLQASRGFRTNNDLKFLIIIILSALLVILIDFWPIQLVYVQAVASLLQWLAITPIQYFFPHWGGAQILIYVREAGTNRIVGGEIDNACAGLMALIPCLLLLLSYDKNQKPKPDRLIIGILAVCIIVMGNFIRIFVELWAPASGFIPFELVHYPLALLTGLGGMIAITIAGQRISTSKS